MKIQMRKRNNFKNKLSERYNDFLDDFQLSTTSLIWWVIAIITIGTIVATIIWAIAAFILVNGTGSNLNSLLTTYASKIDAKFVNLATKNHNSFTSSEYLQAIKSVLLTNNTSLSDNFINNLSITNFHFNDINNTYNISLIIHYHLDACWSNSFNWTSSIVSLI